MRARRDYAMLAMLFGCGLRRSELEVDEIQMRQGHWAVVDLVGKGGHIRTVPIPVWVKAALDHTYHTTFCEIPLPHTFPVLATARKIRPSLISAAAVHW